VSLIASDLHSEAKEQSYRRFILERRKMKPKCKLCNYQSEDEEVFKAIKVADNKNCVICVECWMQIKRQVYFVRQSKGTKL